MRFFYQDIVISYFLFDVANSLLFFFVIIRGCPKAYHPTCVNRDDAFFRAKGKWNCGMFLSYSVFSLL